MNILVIEDERLVAQSLIRMVKQLEPTAGIVGPIASVKESKAWLQQNPLPDLILSDIQLADGISLDIFTCGDLLCPIIFTTAYDEYAIRAFKLNSIDYLLKPIDKADLEAAFRKFHMLRTKYSNAGYLEEVMSVFRNFGNIRKYKERFAVHFGKSVTLVSVVETAYFRKEEIIFLIAADGRKYITDYRSLDEIEEEIDKTVFFRANRQHLVNIAFIESFSTDEAGRITLKLHQLKNEDELVISKERASQFRQWVEASTTSKL